MANGVGVRSIWAVPQEDKMGESRDGIWRSETNELEWLENKGIDWDW